jgi:hypothetical protein
MPCLRDLLPVLLLTGSMMPACGSNTEPPPPPPPPAAVTLTPRHGHAMAYDEVRHQLLLIGGTGAEGSQASGARS